MKKVIVAILAGLLVNLAFGQENAFLTEISRPETFAIYDNYIKLNAPGEDAFVAVQRVAAQYVQERQWEKAADVFRMYSPLFKKMEKRFDKIISMLEAKEEKVILRGLGLGINSESNEYAPTPSADGMLMYFTGYERSDGFGGEDIFVSNLLNNAWQKAENSGSKLNSKTNEAIVSISADGNRIILFGNYKGTLGRGDNFYTDKTPAGWSDIRHFPEPVNSKYFDASAMITSDGNALLFVSDRPGGIGDTHFKGELYHGDTWGNTDIYVCIKKGSGWSEPVNLGAKINTPFAEYSPFLHPDGRTLYFSSSGNYGLGNFDVFKSVRLNDFSWTEWSEPVNLGKEINTAGDDWGYKISTSGDVAYFSGFNGDNNSDDIYSITLPKEVRPERVATIRGKVTDDKGNILETDIMWEDLSSGKNVGQLKSNPQDGTYFIALPLGKNYGYFAEKKGYYPVSKNIDLLGTSESKNITENIVLVSIQDIKEKEISVRINNIFFDYDKYEIKPESFPELDRLVKILKDTDSKVEIAGHTDSRGKDQYNFELSKNRAQAVVNYLVSFGCSSVNLTATGYGETKPISNEETEEGYAQNRRVEFKFIK